MRIAFLSASRYPTEKAYGVTIGRTAQAARQLGNEVQILVPGQATEDNYGNPICGLKVNPIKYRRRWGAHVSALRFYFRLIRISIKAGRLIRKERPDVVWLRDPVAALIILIFSKSNILLELHHIPTGPNFMVVKLLDNQPRVSISTLTDFHIDLLRSMGFKRKILKIGMSFPKEFQEKSSPHWPKSEDGLIRVGYVGKSSSSGFSNGIEKFILELLPLFQTSERFKLIIAGLDINELEFTPPDLSKILQAIHEEKIHIISHLPHERVVEVLKDIDLAILPYPESEYNNMRFPIKILEYGVTGTPIIASNTEVHRRLLNTNNCFFYDPNLAGDLSKVITKAVENFEETSVMKENLMSWASTQSYESRVQIAISNFKSKNS